MFLYPLQEPCSCTGVRPNVQHQFKVIFALIIAPDFSDQQLQSTEEPLGSRGFYLPGCRGRRYKPPPHSLPSELENLKECSPKTTQALIGVYCRDPKSLKMWEPDIKVSTDFRSGPECSTRWDIILRQVHNTTHLEEWGWGKRCCSSWAVGTSKGPSHILSQHTEHLDRTLKTTSFKALSQPFSSGSDHFLMRFWLSLPFPRPSIINNGHAQNCVGEEH